MIKSWAHKNTNQVKTNKQNKVKQTKNNKDNNFLRRKLVRGRKLLILHFLTKEGIALITSFTILLNYAVSILQLWKYFYPSISTHKTLWPTRQDQLLLTHGNFENAGWKPVRGRFHGCATLTGFQPCFLERYKDT